MSDTPKNGTAPSSIRQNLIFNAILTRALLTQATMDRRRSIPEECGYPDVITTEMYHTNYDRDPIAARVVQVLPDETWQVYPSVYEDENPGVLTKFERAWLNLGSSLYVNQNWYRDEESGLIMNYLHRVDELSGIGRYGILLLGLNDGKALEEPAVPMEYDKNNSKLLYLRAFPEKFATITKLETDVKNPRFGSPLEYEITFDDPNNQTYGTELVRTTTRKVHWTRVLHVADNRTSSEVYGVPRQQRVFNNILNLQKLYGGSAEMYWRGAFPGYALETHPQLGTEVDVDDEATKDMMEDYMNGLQRYFRLIGMTAKSLAPQVVDPSPQIERQIEAICIHLNVPKRIFMGSERGELASSQDQKGWNRRIWGRQSGYTTQWILVPFINHLIYLGYLPRPKGLKGTTTPEIVTNALGQVLGTRIRTRGGYTIWWPDVSAQSNQEKANVALTMVQAMSTYMSGKVPLLLPMKYLLTSILGFTDAEAVEILKTADEEREKNAEILKKGEPEKAGPSSDAGGNNLSSGDGRNADKDRNADAPEDGKSQGDNPPNQPPTSRGRGNGAVARSES